QGSRDRGRIHDEGERPRAPHTALRPGRVLDFGGMTQRSAAKCSRVLLKLSGEALLGERKFGISPQYVKYLAEEIRKVQALPAEVATVIGGGNIMRGAAVAEHGIDRATADYMGMLAMVINAL